MEEQQHQPCINRIQKWFIDLTNQLIKNYKISNAAYLVIKIFQYMQLAYFVMRVQTSYHWNFSFVSYFSIFVNYTVADSNIRINSAIFSPLIYLIALSVLLVIVLGVIIGVQAGWGKKMPLIIKIVIPILNIFLYFFKYILTIPTLQVIFICLSPKAQTALKLGNDSGIYVAFGSLILICFLMVKIYIITFYRQSNPFSDMQHAGETVYRALFIFFVKFMFCLYSILDLNGEMEGTFNILFTLTILIIIIQSHYQVGLYKRYPKVLQFKLMYLLLCIGFLQALDFYSPYQVTSFTYLIPFFIFAHLISDWIIEWQQSKAILLNLILNNSPQRLESHILTLIYIIDSLQIRQNRIKLEGYLHIHRRQCRNGPECPCRNLGVIRERDEQTIKVEYFKLVVVILAESRRKYTHYHNIDLLLGLVYHFRIKNPLQAIYAFTKLITSHKKNLINRLFVSYYLQRVQEDMKQLEEKQMSRTNDINKFLQYTNKMVVFEEHVENCTKHHIEFWRLMLDSSPQIKRLEDLGTMITRNKDYLKEQFQDIFEHNPNSIHLLTIYGKFLLQVTNEQNYNVKYLEKAESILNNIKYSSKVDETCSKYNENAQTGVIVINGSQGQLGNIIHTNNLIKQLLGYRRNQLLDRNVEMIMPKIFGDQHNAILSRYIAASESKVNGHQRIVPALNKQGFILPTNALTKALPTLTDGIQIVGFLAKMEENFKEDQEPQKNINYMLYRSDNEQILGISQGCYEDYHIHPSLIYGNPYNINNELKIKHLFGVSFERSQQGKIAAALQAGQVQMTVNTKSLKDEFIISKNSSKENLVQIQEQQSEKEGIQMQLVARNIITTLYQGITLKLIALYPKKAGTMDRHPSKRNNSALYKPKRQSPPQIKREKVFEQATKTDTDDLKNLKDFKNFISIKSQPSAITALSAICICFILIMCSSTIGLIVNWFNIISINQNMMSLSQLTLYSELSTPEMMTKTQKQIIGLSTSLWNITNFTSYSQSNNQLIQIISSLKNWQLNILPYKYTFNPTYNDQTTQYSLLSSGQIIKQTNLVQLVINNYISQVETISLTNISSLKNFTVNLQSNIYEKYSSVKMNELYSIRQALSTSNANQWNWYKSSTNITTNIIIIVCSIMIGGIVLWLVLLLPYILSVTKINNRVLSLFSLIPYAQICKLIHGCMLFLKTNLSETNINTEDLKFYESEQNVPSSRVNETQMNSPSSIYSPSQLGLMSDNSFTQSNMLRKPDEVVRGGADSVMMIEQKFEKMKNSEDRNKKLVIMKFLLISLVILAFVLFYLFYCLSILNQASKNISNFQIIGRRPALIRNAKLLIIEYLINPLYNPLGSNTNSIKNMNMNMINEFYSLEANILYLNLGTSQAKFNNYNNGDVCSMIHSFSGYSIFNEQFSSSECYKVHSQILQKGVKTGIVDALESIRSLVSQYNATVPRSVLASNVLIFDSLAKYIQTPMLAVLNSINSNLNDIIASSRIAILTSGGIFIFGLILCWRILWTRYLSELNIKIWRTKGLLNLIPMRIITTNDLLKNQFTSGQLENAVR